MSRDTGEGHASFQARLERAEQARRARMPRSQRRGSLLRNLLYPLTFVSAFFWGIVGGLASRYGQYHLNGLDAKLAVTAQQFFIDSCIAAATIFALRIVTNRPTPHHMVFLMAGVWGVTITFHNLAHWFPEPMAMAFSPNWVFQMRKLTEPESLAIFGGFIPF